ncbi:MAG: hypothetical protein IKL05_01675 [Clostridia bacterium]|nr:hypothetical protein [Clostridia bacterium]
MNNVYIKTKFLEIIIDSQGRMVSAIERESGKNILKNTGDFFSCLYTERAFIENHIDMFPANDYFYVAGQLEPTSAVPIPTKALERRGDTLIALYENGVEIRFEIKEYDEYFTIQAMDNLPEKVYSVTFANMEFDFDRENDITPVVFAMNVKVKPHFYPTPIEGATRCEIFSKIDAKGAKVAITTVKEKDLILLERRLADLCDKNEMPVSKAGGPYADTVSDAIGTYVLIRDIDDRSDIDGIAQRYKHFGIKQIDVHQGTAYSSADFAFDPKRYPGGIDEFRETVVEPLKKHGFTMGLHPYSCFFSQHCHSILSDPESQKQIYCFEYFTLGEDLDADCLEMTCREDLSGVSNVTGYRNTNSLFLLIDEEFVKYERTEGNKFILAERGIFGTKPSAHKKGAEIGHPGLIFTYFSPKFQSELFYRIARNTAEAYNRGGFNMIYLDALDGIPFFDEEYAWYHIATFVLEVLKYCETPPLLEYATMFPHIWYCRSRCGAFDVPVRCHKEFIDFHAEFNETQPHMYNLPRLLGWYNFYPPAKFAEAFPGKIIRFMHKDDADNAGARAIGFDQSMAYHVLEESVLEKYPQLRTNIECYALCERLRNKKYFSDETRAKLRDLSREFALTEENGEYFFEEWHWERVKDNPTRIECPFEPKELVMRLEPLYTGEGDELKLTDKVGVTQFDQLLNLGTKQSVKLEVEGVGDGESQLLVEMKTPIYMSNAILSYIFDVGFEGKKTFIVGEDDNEKDKTYFEGSNSNIRTKYMGLFDFASVENVKVFVKGKAPKSFTVSAIETVPAVFNRPSVTVNGERLTFDCTVKSGEYIELTTSGAVKKDIFGNAEPIEYTGKLPIARIIDAEVTAENKSALTFGFRGNRI